MSPHKNIMIQTLLGAALITIIGLSTAIYVQKIIDHVIPSQNSNLLNLLGLGMIILVTFQVIINFIKSLFVIKVGQQIDAKLILGYYKHLLSLPQRFFDTMRVGEITSRINDAVKIRVFINQTAIDVIINVFILIFSFCLMFTYYWKLAVIMLLVIPFYALTFLITNRLNRKAERKVMENAAELESQLVESLNSVKTIKAFGMQNYSNLKTEVRFVDLLSSVYKSGLNGIFSGNASLTISRLFTIILLWVGAGFVIQQAITPGELMSFYAIIGYFTGPASGLIGANKAFQNARIAADRLFEIMDLDSQYVDNPIKIERVDVGDIKFQNVGFRYGTRVTVFEDLSLNIQKGSLTAIIGESGSGKSTIASLVKRLYPVEKGKIFLGDYDLSMIDPDSLNDLISIVPQQVDLFAGTIIENVALGEFQPDVKRIVTLANDLGMTDFINEMPGGFGSLLGENGQNLSGGQKQRIAILRAMYPDPEIIIFDEATSALDGKSESFFLQTVKRLKDQGKTIIIITHRLSSIIDADEIFILEKGKLAGNGTHALLLEKNEKYISLWSKQNGNMVET